MAERWWDSVATIDGVLAEADRQDARRGGTHSPPPGMVAAFTLAKLGDMDSARERLARVELWDEDYRPPIAARLEELAQPLP